MVFSSMFFLCIFLPVVFLLYCLIPVLKVRNALLIAASLVFYAYGEPIYVFLMLFSVLLNYLFGLVMAGRRTGAKLWLALAVLANLGILGIFKYTGFAVENVNAILGFSLPVPIIRLPIGISFFTFQALSYVIDVYRGQAKRQKNFGKILLYVSFFPQLIAGPIVKYHDIDMEISNRQLSAEGAAKGIRRFIAGLSKKVLIANTMGMAADYVFGLSTGQVNIGVAWIGALAYLLQIYYDFSGYSDMAIGLGWMFGFHFKENFQYPYRAVGIKDFWTKWHISLSTWFKEYLYIPLGGNRKGRIRTGLNKGIVFFCTGLWHGASWNFVIWGFVHGFFSIWEDTRWFFLRKLKQRWLLHLYALLVVTVAFVLFRAETLGQGFHMISQMFMGFHFDAVTNSTFWEPLTPKFFFMLITGAVLSVPVWETMKIRLQEKRRIMNTLETISYPISILMLLICLLSLSADTYNPFIYFRF